jgi:hypothetical protein
MENHKHLPVSLRKILTLYRKRAPADCGRLPDLYTKNITRIGPRRNMNKMHTAAMPTGIPASGCRRPGIRSGRGPGCKKTVDVKSFSAIFLFFRI